MFSIDKYFDDIRKLYISSTDVEKQKIEILLEKISNKVETKDINSITKLPNKESLSYELSLISKNAMLMFFHVNQVNAIQELYGIELAHEIVLDKAEQLKEVMSSKNVSIYNISTEKFVVLVKDELAFEKYLSILKYSIFNDVERDIYSCDDGKSIVADFTVGISYGNKYLYDHAYVALQESIINKTNFKIYESNSDSKELQRTSLNRLKVYKSALHEGNIIPYFQPIVDSKDETIMKYEALARIKTPDGEIISPYEFLNTAIEDKTFEFFTRQMTQKVFNIYEKTHVELSMNLTYTNINSPSMVSYLKNRLEKYGGDRMTFEIVETEEIKDYSIVEDFILMVKEYGVKVSIDDFGSGYSNFTNIIKLNIDYIKIDGTLITKLLSDKKVKNIVRGLVDFAKSIDVKTIAEFVSTQELADEVKLMKIDYIQGYSYGQPEPAKYYGLK